jgi:Ner family transcriptional regulator
MANRRRKRAWHPELIKAELKMRGHTFSSIGRKLGYADPGTPNKVLFQRWPFMERWVADLLGVHPSEIWPERYRLDGSPAARGMRKAYRNFRPTGNSQSAGAA